MWFISFRDLQYRQRRFVIAILGTGLVFALSLIGSGISASFRAEVVRTMDAIDADAWVIPAGSTGPFTSFSLIPADTARALRGDEGTTKASPIAILHHSFPLEDGPMDAVIIGVRPNGVGAPPLSAGRSFRSPGEVVVDEAAGLPLNTILEIGQKRVTVVGHTKGLSLNAGAPLIFANLQDLQVAVFGDRLATAIATRGVPAVVPAGYVAVTDAAARADVLRPFLQAIGTIDLVKMLLWIVAASIIGAMVYLSTLERLRDFAVLRAIGSGARELLGGLAMQAILVTLASAVVAMAAASAMAPFFPMRVEIPLGAYAALPVIATVVGLAASTAGLRRATNVDPALAFGG